MRIARSAATTALTLGLLVAVLGGCGGGSGATTGPSSTAGGTGGSLVQGQIVRTGRTALGESRTVVVLRAVLGIGLAEAAIGDPVAGVTVTVTGTGGTFSTVTGADGSFLFPSVPPGTYTIEVTDPGATPPKVYVVTGTTSVVVGAGDTATIAGTVTQADLLATTVTVTATDFGDVLANDAQLAHAINIALESQQSLEEIIAYRQAGHGWGEVARHFGVHPGVLGLGASPESLASARASHGRGKGKHKI